MGNVVFRKTYRNGREITMHQDGLVQVTLHGITHLQFKMVRPLEITTALGDRGNHQQIAPGWQSSGDVLITREDAEELNRVWNNINPPQAG